MWDTKEVEKSVEKIDRTKQEVFDFIDENEIDIDKIKASGITMRVGEKLVKFEIASEDSLSDAISEIKEEYRIKIKERLMVFKDFFDKKLNESKLTIISQSRELERVEAEYREKMKSSRLMPDIRYEHAIAGCSVVKGNSNDELIWLVNGIYSPKTLDRKRIKPSVVKNMSCPVTYVIRTRGDKTTHITVRTVYGLKKFPHYHSLNNDEDCWGNSFSNKISSYRWKTPDDIIRIAREAEGVLEDINVNSLGTEEPADLPTIGFLRRNLVDKVSQEERESETSHLSKIGVERNPSQSANEGIWET